MKYVPGQCVQERSVEGRTGAVCAAVCMYRREAYWV